MLDRNEGGKTQTTGRLNEGSPLALQQLCDRWDAFLRRRRAFSSSLKPPVLLFMLLSCTGKVKSSDCIYLRRVLCMRVYAHDTGKANACTCAY